jgi:hypothetical protein
MGMVYANKAIERKGAKVAKGEKRRGIFIGFFASFAPLR